MTIVAYTNARLLDPASNLDVTGDLLIAGETIAAIGPGIEIPSDAPRIDCGGAFLAPGLVDMRVAIGEPGYEAKETIATASRAAAVGGVTTMAMLPNTDPVIDDVAGLEFVARRAREVKLVKIFAYGAASRDCAGRELADLGLLAEAGAVAFTDGIKPIADAQMMRRALAYARMFGRPIVQHCEEPRLAENGQMNEGEVATRLGLAGIPAAAEAILLARDLRLVELTGGRYHAAHVSTAESVQLLRDAKARGLAVTADTAPPYFLLTEADVGDWRTFAKLSPPLRGEADRAAVAAGVADGTIDAIASDHQPQDEDQKRVPFAQAAPGAAGLETLLPLSLSLVRDGRLGMLELVRRLSLAPARILGLPSGTLSVGAAADLVLFDAETPGNVQPAQFRSKSKNSPFEGYATHGRVLRTVVDGRSVHTG